MSFQMSTTTLDPSSLSNEVRKRRGSFPQVSNESLSAEMLAPLPQANILRTVTMEDLHDESKPLLKVIGYYS